MALYSQYRQDEPWDSEHNRQVLAQMPDVYRSPLDQARSTTASCFALVGPETVFPGSQNARITDILDGTSTTMLVVESKQETPWTKPEDIPFDGTQPTPKLGGWYPDGFCGALCDGSVRFFAAEQFPDRMLRLLIRRADGQPIAWPRR